MLNIFHHFSQNPFRGISSRFEGHLDISLPSVPSRFEPTLPHTFYFRFTTCLKIKETAYNTYVRPQLEYCAPVWHPWQGTLCSKIESVQRAAARYALNDYSTTSSVTKMLDVLHWQTLEHRRIQNSRYIAIQN